MRNKILRKRKVCVFVCVSQQSQESCQSGDSDFKERKKTKELPRKKKEATFDHQL